VRAPVDHIAAPAFPPRLPWINGGPLRIEQLHGHPVLIEFWDFCRPNSIRTLPYVKAWHERYGGAGLQVIGVHAAGFPPSRDPDAVREAVRRLEIPYPVAVDVDLEVWRLYGNFGWPARYLFGGEGTLFDYHYGEGEYAEGERAIQTLLEIEREPVPPVRPEDAPGAVLEPQSPDVEGPYSGPYRAGAVWAVLDGRGSVRANGAEIAVDHPGCYELISHPSSAAGELALEIGPGVVCHATCFTPGVAP
jgi:hypothetical protein